MTAPRASRPSKSRLRGLRAAGVLFLALLVMGVSGDESRIVPDRHLARSMCGCRGGPLRKNQDAGNDEQQQRGRRRIAAQGKAARIERLVEKIADHGTQWPGQDKRGPEQYG